MPGPTVKEAFEELQESNRSLTRLGNLLTILAFVSVSLSSISIGICIGRYLEKQSAFFKVEAKK